MQDLIDKPWGTYEILSTRTDFNLKKIVVKPGCQPSYQYHSKRSEHWVIVSGECEVTLDGEKSLYSSNQHVFVPVGSKHRIKNTSSVNDLIFIEVQTGTYFGEDDIVRLEDDYGR